MTTLWHGDFEAPENLTPSPFCLNGCVSRWLRSFLEQWWYRRIRWFATRAIGSLYQVQGHPSTLHLPGKLLGQLCPQDQTYCATNSYRCTPEKKISLWPWTLTQGSYRSSKTKFPDFPWLFQSITQHFPWPISAQISVPKLHHKNTITCNTSTNYALKHILMHI